MIKHYETENSTYIVDPDAKTVVRIHKGQTGMAQAYEFIQHHPSGGLYFHAIDPDTGTLRPFTTSRVVSAT